MQSRPVPTIVVGSGHTALGALRALVLAGVPAYVACPAGDLATGSRWYRPPPGVGEGLPDSAGSDAWLDAVALDRAVLLPGQDDAAMWISRVPGSRHANRFAASSSPVESLAVLQDKTRFGEFLASRDIPHPRTYSLHAEADIDAVPFDTLERVFVKPADSQRFSSSLGVKGLWVRDRAQLLGVWRDLRAQGFDVVAQEYVSGRSSDHYFIDGFRGADGQLAALFARRRERIFPADFGNSSYCRSIALSDVDNALPGLETLLRELRYRGIFSAEFKRDAGTGQFKLLEVNTRAWWYVEFAARCGVNVCALAVADALGQPLPPRPAYRAGAGCVSLAGDIKAHFGQPRESRLPLARVLGQWLRAHYHVFRYDDPLPGLRVFGANLRRRLERSGAGPTRPSHVPAQDAPPPA